MAFNYGHFGMQGPNPLGNPAASLTSSQTRPAFPAKPPGQTRPPIPGGPAPNPFERLRPPGQTRPPVYGSPGDKFGKQPVHTQPGVPGPYGPLPMQPGPGFGGGMPGVGGAMRPPMYGNPGGPGGGWMQPNPGMPGYGQRPPVHTMPGQPDPFLGPIQAQPQFSPPMPNQGQSWGWRSPWGG